jgi:hypothetical protein
MDRDLRVLKDGYTLGEINFEYETQTSGNARITVNKVADLKDGLKTVYPLYTIIESFSHGAFSSIEETKAFDETFFKRQPETEAQLNGDIKYEYTTAHYRYLIKTTITTGIDNKTIITAGIADIYANFSENKKELSFISARRISSDHEMPSDSLETNFALLNRLCALETIDCMGANYEAVHRK